MPNILRVDIPHRIRENSTIGTGLSSWVLRVDAVAKCYTRHVEKEKEIAVYERLGSHKTILQYYGSLDGSVLLKFAPFGTVRQYLGSSRHEPPLGMRLQWVEQTTEAISFIHSKGILHCDISSNNVFLDADYNAMVGDFSGSSIDKEAPLGWYGTSHSHPDIENPSEETEIFALGSTFYEILTGKNPFEGYASVEIEKAIRDSDFPKLDHLPALRTVISKCWKGGYRTVDELLLEVKQGGTALLFFSYASLLIKVAANTSLSVIQHQASIDRWLVLGLAMAIALPIAWRIGSLRLLWRS